MDYKALEIKFKPIIQKMIDDNKRFYFFDNKIKWSFFVNEDKGVVAINTAELELKVNIIAVDFAYNSNQPLMIEFFILHEIRHIYQRLLVSALDCRNVQNNELIRIYKNEFDNYCNIYQSREIYYSQQIEFDAFIYSYSVMKYKYGQIDYIQYPYFYDENNVDVDKYVNNFIQGFSSHNL